MPSAAGASAAAGGAASGGDGADAARWRRAAEAEASARRLLQAAMEEFYGAAADAAWLETQGVAVGDLLPEGETDGACPTVGGVAAEGRQAHGKRSGLDTDGDGGTAGAVIGEHAGREGEQGGGGGILGRFFGM